jgi:hypothetical protein
MGGCVSDEDQAGYRRNKAVELYIENKTSNTTEKQRFYFWGLVTLENQRF